MRTQAPELPWFDFSRSKLHNHSYFHPPADTSFQLSGPSWHSSLLVSIAPFLPPCSFYQKSCICHFLSHLPFYVTSNQYIKTLFQLLLPYSNFLHFCKSGSFLSPPSCYAVFCATLFPTPALLLHASYPPPQSLSSHMAACTPPQQVTELGLWFETRTSQGR